MNKEARPFEEYKEMIQDMSKDNMIKGLYDLSANIIEKDKEIERLNNIISIKTTYIEDLLKSILKSTDIKIQREVYEHGIEYDRKLKELKEGKE